MFGGGDPLWLRIVQDGRAASGKRAPTTEKTNDAMPRDRYLFSVVVFSDDLQGVGGPRVGVRAAVQSSREIFCRGGPLNRYQ